MIQLFKNSLYVFLGACSFGILSTIVKTAYGAGFTLHDVMGGQYGVGWTIMLILMLIFSRKRVSIKSFIRLTGVGACTFLTGVFYYFSLQSLPASIAIILLFQFTWIGVVIESIVTRKWPSKATTWSIILLLIGTILAGGIISGDDIQLNVTGVLLGLGAALMMALFVFFSGRVETDLPLITRSFFISTGSFALMLIMVTPGKFIEISINQELWSYGLILGVFGAVLPVLLFGLGAPKLSPGLASILSAGELPVAVTASVIILHEQVTPVQWAGVIVILLGIAYPQVYDYAASKLSNKIATSKH